MVARQTIYKEASFFQEKLAWLKDARLSLLDKLEVDTQPRLRKIKLIGLSQISRRLAIMAYTAGEPIETFSAYARDYIADKVAYLDETGALLIPDGSLEQYIDCLWLLSFCYFFDVEVGTVNKIANSIPDSYRDKLVDRIVYACTREYTSMSQSLAFPGVYEKVSEALGVYEDDVRDELIASFMDGYYDSLKGKDVTWYDSHKETDPDYCKHFGYWFFEVAVLVADIGWDDSSIRRHPMYPKDLVDWKRSQLVSAPVPKPAY